METDKKISACPHVWSLVQHSVCLNCGTCHPSKEGFDTKKENTNDRSE